MINTQTKLKHVVAHYLDIFCSPNEKDELMTQYHFSDKKLNEHTRYNVWYSKERDSFIIKDLDNNICTQSDNETTLRFESYAKAVSKAKLFNLRQGKI